VQDVDLTGGQNFGEGHITLILLRTCATPYLPPSHHAKLTGAWTQRRNSLEIAILAEALGYTVWFTKLPG
jgi:hypothetical protein